MRDNKTFQEWQHHFDRYWSTKTRTGMIKDHIKLADEDSRLASYEVDYLLNKESGRVSCSNAKSKLGFLGRKCVI